MVVRESASDPKRTLNIAGFLSFGELVKLVGASINVPAGMIVETELAGPLDLPL